METFVQLNRNLTLKVIIIETFWLYTVQPTQCNNYSNCCVVFIIVELLLLLLLFIAIMATVFLPCKVQPVIFSSSTFRCKFVLKSQQPVNHILLLYILLHLLHCLVVYVACVPIYIASACLFPCAVAIQNLNDKTKST